MRMLITIELCRQHIFPSSCHFNIGTCVLSHVVCPLCGRSVPIDGFDPSEFVDDVFAQAFSGKGRGKGFRVADKFSVLGEEGYYDLLKSMADRALRLVRLFKRFDYLTEEEITEAFTESEE